MICIKQLEKRSPVPFRCRMQRQNDKTGLKLKIEKVRPFNSLT